MNAAAQRHIDDSREPHKHDLAREHVRSGMPPLELSYFPQFLFEQRPDILQAAAQSGRPLVYEYGSGIHIVFLFEKDKKPQVDEILSRQTGITAKISDSSENRMLLEISSSFDPRAAVGASASRNQSIRNVCDASDRILSLVIAGAEIPQPVQEIDPEKDLKGFVKLHYPLLFKAFDLHKTFDLSDVTVGNKRIVSGRFFLKREDQAEALQQLPSAKGIKMTVANHAVYFQLSLDSNSKEALLSALLRINELLNEADQQNLLYVSYSK